MICKKCNNYFPTRTVIDGKQRNLCKRKYCLSCSPFGLHNTQRIDVDYVDKNANVILNCILCNREYVYKRNRGGTKKMCNSCSIKNRYRKLKQKYVSMKGGKCEKCGYRKSLKALVFHHLNPKTKLFGISDNYNKSFATTLKELDKCILLCQNCHAELHDEFKTLTKPLDHNILT